MRFPFRALSFRLSFVIVSIIASAAVFALAAANTVPVSGNGEGQAAISGYNVGNITYQLNSTSPTNIDNVRFDLAPITNTGTTLQPSVVKVRLVTGGSWYSANYMSSSGITTTWVLTPSPTLPVTQTDFLVISASQ